MRRIISLAVILAITAACFATSVQAQDKPAKKKGQRVTELFDGKWAMVRVDLITPTHIPELKTIRTQVGARMRGEREDELFDTLIAEWMSEFMIVRHPERLKDAVFAPQPTGNTISVGG